MHIKPSKVFERQGDDIYMEMPISFAAAALGSEIEVPTIDGKAKMKIPSGTQSNTIFKLRGKGIPNLRGYGTGDQKDRVIIDIPKSLSKKQKELLEEFDKSSRQSSKGIFDKIKESF